MNKGAGKLKSKKKQINKKSSKNTLTNKILQKEDEKIKNVSYIELYKYSNVKEKLMIAVGVIGAIIQGCTIPFMYVLTLYYVHSIYNFYKFYFRLIILYY